MKMVYIFAPNVNPIMVLGYIQTEMKSVFCTVPHNLKDVERKKYKALDVIKVVALSKWGADKIKRLHFLSLTCPIKIDYGCKIYMSARSSHIKVLDAIHHQGLWLCLDALRTSLQIFYTSKQANHLSAKTYTTIHCLTSSKY